jgi:hypothetical protein
MPPTAAGNPASKSSGAPLPVAEDLEEPVARFGWDRISREPAQSSNCLSYLLQVRAAAGALCEMRIEPRTRAAREAALDVVRNELHNLLARQVVCVRHGGSTLVYAAASTARGAS